MKKLIFIIVLTSLILTGCLERNLNIEIKMPKFPHNTEKQVIRELAVFYSPDDISSGIVLKDMGFPDSGLFLLHKDHPQLKITMQTVPKLYHGKEITESPESARLWRMIMYNETFTSWMELGNHGYTHSPPGCEDKKNLVYHEFDAEERNPPCFDRNLAKTLSYCNQRFELARQAYEKIGLDNDRIIVMRFPGNDYTDAALRALLDNGFVGFFGLGEWAGWKIPTGPKSLSPRWKCREIWLDLSDSREILNIPTNVGLYELYKEPITDFFIINNISNTFAKIYYFPKAQYYCIKYNCDLNLKACFSICLFKNYYHNYMIKRCVQNGGILNFFDHWWDMFENNSKGKQNYLTVNDTLNYIEQKYEDKIWWPFGSELALWLYMKRNVNTTLMTIAPGPFPSSLHIKSQVPIWNPNWREINISYSVRLPKNIIVKKISYLDKKQWKDLPKNWYWQDNSFLYVNVPFQNPTKIEIKLAKE